MNNYIIKHNDSISKAIKKLNANRVKCLIVIDSKNLFFGTLSDGDLRKSFLQGVTVKMKVSDVCQTNSVYFFEHDLKPKEIDKIFNEKDIHLIPILDKKKKIKFLKINKRYNSKFSNNNFQNKYKKSALFIMAGGEGTRMSPFTKILPKALIPIKKNKTILEYIIDNFIVDGFKNIYLSINTSQKIIPLYLKEVYLGNKFSYLYEKVKLGTAGSLKNFYDLHYQKYDQVLVSNCDIFTEISIEDLFNYHLENKNDITTVVSNKTITVPYGVCKISKNGILKNILEKPSHKYHVNIGIYLFDIKVLSKIPTNKYFDMNQLFQLALKLNYKVGTFMVDNDSWFDVGQWSEYDEALNKIT